MNTKVNIGVLYWPSTRSIAYLSVFNDLGIAPSHIFMMEGSTKEVVEKISFENEKYAYSKQFFDVKFNVDTFLISNNIEVIHLASRDINSELVKTTLSQYNLDYMIFSGGGILKPETLSIPTPFVHVHPGLLPDFRGSTCFYYSILDNNTVGASAILMDEHIDTGNVVADQQFEVNYQINADQPMFMDYILDAYIRATTLKKFLNKYLENNKVEAKVQEFFDEPAYYIMHPFLRHKAIDKINQTYNPQLTQGINAI